MTGKTCVITGVNSGIGKETAVELARMGARIVGVARDRSRGEAACEEIRRRSGGSVELLLADLSLMAATRRLADAVIEKCPHIDVLVNNAGVCNFKIRNVTTESIELTLATNYYSPFLLTNLLLDRLKASAPSRIVNVSSQMHRKVLPELVDLRGEKVKVSEAYGLSKLHLVMFTHELARRLEGTGVSAHVLCPGGVATALWNRMGGPVGKVTRLLINVFMKGPRVGARVPVYVASSPDLDGVTGKYFEVTGHFTWSRIYPRETETRASAISYDVESQRELWEASAKLTGVG